MLFLFILEKKFYSNPQIEYSLMILRRALFRKKFVRCMVVSFTAPRSSRE